MKKKIILITTLILLIITILNIVLNLSQTMALKIEEQEVLDDLGTNIKIGNSTQSVTTGWIGGTSTHTIPYDTFKTASNMFCLNAGLPYTSNVQFKKGYLILVIKNEIYSYNYDERKWEDYSSYSSIKENINIDLDLKQIYAISYVLAKSTNTTKEEVSDSIYQQAIWKILGQTTKWAYKENETNALYVQAINYASHVIDSNTTKYYNAIFYILDAEESETTYIQNYNNNDTYYICNEDIYENQRKFNQEVNTYYLRYYASNGLHEHIITLKLNGKYKIEHYYIPLNEEKNKEYNIDLNASIDNFNDKIKENNISKEEWVEECIVEANTYKSSFQNVLIGKATEYEEEETISLSGKVWLDGQQGLKPVSVPNGYFDTNENCLEGITVCLYDNDTNEIIKTTSTDKNGNYKFTDIPKNTNGYKIQFAYDGINYIVTEPNVNNNLAQYTEINSNVVDVERARFNNKFAKIEKGEAINNTGARSAILTYKYTDDKAILNLEDSSYHLIWAETTKSYNETTKFINMGLVKKGVDLSAYTSIDSAKVSINGKTITYKGTSINNIINGNESATYNIYLYNSDYNYRIGDYKGLKENTTNEETETFKNNSSELEVGITYKVILNNESVTPAKINKIAYYCDMDLDINTINDSNHTYIYKGNKTINGKNYNKYEITFLKPIELNNENNQYVFNLEFSVAKDDLGHIILDENKNYVEILSYSTDTGCIDCDSEPGNIEEHPNEDDSDDAPVINISLTEEGRKISGFVFEDLKTTDNQFGNGYYEEETENKVNDVIVQLIEKKSIEINGTTQNLEYIWQETVSGSNKVKCVSLDGQYITSYNVENADGQYQFKDFIPGNYIIRFIYGDGTYYDTAIDGTTATDKSKANILKYNGQAYKSAMDLGYKETFYDNEFYGQMGCEKYENDESGTNNIFYKANLSKARDNEARRLEEMAYATENTTSLVIDSKDKLENTWMCAETSNIVVSVGSGTKFEQNNVNFGLILRPHSSYTLEKHIVKLKVDDIADVEVTKDTNGNYIFENGLLGYSDSIGGLVLATATAKDTAIGRWTIETDLDNVRGGISITYCYKITNNGESEYIGAKLSEALNNGKSYSDLAGEVKKYQKTSNSNVYSGIGMYLGTTYYTGNIGTDIAIGGAGSVKVEDYLSSNTKRTLSIKNDEFTSAGTATKSVWIDNSTTGQEEVQVIQSKEISLAKGESKYIYLELAKDNVDTTTIKEGLKYRSYAAQLISSDNMASTTLGNLQYVQAYTDDVPVRDIVPEDDEFIAETVIITKSTGLTDVITIENTNNSTMKIVIAVTSGLVIIAIGAVLIKKFII